MKALADKIAGAPLQQDWTAQLHSEADRAKYDRVILKLTDVERCEIVTALRAYAPRPNSSGNLTDTIDAIIADNVYVDNDGVAGISAAAEAIVSAITSSDGGVEGNAGTHIATEGGCPTRKTAQAGAKLAGIKPGLSDPLSAASTATEASAQYREAVESLNRMNDKGEIAPTTSPNPVVADHATTETPEPDAVREALEPFAKYEMLVIGDPFSLKKSDLKDCDYVVGFAGPVQPEFRHFAAAKAALNRPAHGGWEDISTAPTDGTYILAIVAPNRGRHLEHNAGRMFVIRHAGKTDSGFDLGWSVYPGFGGASDADFTCWQPVSAPTIARNDRGSPS